MLDKTYGFHVPYKSTFTSLGGAPSCGAHLVRSRDRSPPTQLDPTDTRWARTMFGQSGKGIWILQYFALYEDTCVYIYICIFFCKYMYIYINQPTKACFYVSRTSHALILRGATRMSIEWVKVPLVVTDNFLEVEMKRWLLRSYVVVGGRHWDFDLSNAKQHL